LERRRARACPPVIARARLGGRRVECVSGDEPQTFGRHPLLLHQRPVLLIEEHQ
jgi:hypothetical protein